MVGMHDFELGSWSPMAMLVLRASGQPSLSPGVSINASRFRFPVTAVQAAADQIGMGPVEFVAAPGPLDDAIKLLNPPSIDVYSLAFTSTSYVGDDNELVERLSAAAHGKPVVTTGQALLACRRPLRCEERDVGRPTMVPSDSD